MIQVYSFLFRILNIKEYRIPHLVFRNPKRKGCNYVELQPLVLLLSPMASGLVLWGYHHILPQATRVRPEVHRPEDPDRHTVSAFEIRIKQHFVTLFNDMIWCSSLAQGFTNKVFFGTKWCGNVTETHYLVLIALKCFQNGVHHQIVPFPSKWFIICLFNLTQESH